MVVLSRAAVWQSHLSFLLPLPRGEGIEGRVNGVATFSPALLSTLNFLLSRPSRHLQLLSTTGDATRILQIYAISALQLIAVKHVATMLA